MTVQYIPVLDQTKIYYFHIGRLRTCALNDATLVSDFNVKWWWFFKVNERYIIKRLLYISLYNTKYIWTRTQLEKSYWTRLSARPIWLFKLCTRPNIFLYCTAKCIITCNYSACWGWCTLLSGYLITRRKSSIVNRPWLAQIVLLWELDKLVRQGKVCTAGLTSFGWYCSHLQDRQKDSILYT